MIQLNIQTHSFLHKNYYLHVQFDHPLDMKIQINVTPLTSYDILFSQSLKYQLSLMFQNDRA
jgi:hypothetical protein